MDQSQPVRIPLNLVSLMGALMGGTLGYLGFFWLLGQGFFGLVLPGGLLGLGAGVVRNRGGWVPWVCGLMALVLGFVADYRSLANPPELSEFLSRLLQRQPVTLLMLAVGTAIGFYVPWSRREWTGPRPARARGGS